MTKPDPVADGDLLTSAWLNQLLAAIPQVQSGRASVPSVPLNTRRSVTVVFDQEFASVPNVTATVLTTGPEARHITVFNVTTTGFDAWVYQTIGGGTTINFEWIAVLA